MQLTRALVLGSAELSLPLANLEIPLLVPTGPFSFLAASSRLCLSNPMHKALLHLRALVHRSLLPTQVER